VRMEELHRKPFNETMTVEERVLVMISKIMAMTRLLSKCVFSGTPKLMNDCETLGREVRQEEKVLTTELVSSKVNPALLGGVIRFPFRLERIAGTLESISQCCRSKVRDGTAFSDKAHAELDQLFAVLLDMMTNLRDAFVTPNPILLEHIISQGKKLAQMLLDFRMAHWARLEAGFCAPHASSAYLAILDCMTSVNTYLQKMCMTLRELQAGAMQSEEFPETAE